MSAILVSHRIVGSIPMVDPPSETSRTRFAVAHTNPVYWRWSVKDPMTSSATAA